MKETIKKMASIVAHNSFMSNGKLAAKNRVNLEYWDSVVNIGDQISKPIVEWMLSRKGLQLDQEVNKTIHLMSVGSIIGCGYFDATVWGSGINTPIAIYRTGRWRRIAHYDVRAVRGPLSKQVLESFGYDCNNCVFGDPGVLMPFIYSPNSICKKYDISIIKHFKTVNSRENAENTSFHIINVDNADYKNFIDNIVASKKIISSSLHGIILAEAYGVPAVFLNENGSMDREIIKYYDWYYSTGRRDVICAKNIEEAINAQPMPLPKLEAMREGLLECFPYDLWK